MPPEIRGKYLGQLLDFPESELGLPLRTSPTL
jgi:hypothetical protein